MHCYCLSPTPTQKVCNCCQAKAATDFFTHYCKSVSIVRVGLRYANRFLLLIALFIAILGGARASELSVRNASLTPSKQGYVVNGDFDLNLNQTLEEALERGVVLFFVIESRVWRPRWWWFSNTIATAQETRKLSYNSLTRQYRVSSGNNYQNFSSLDDAQTDLAQLRNQILAEPNALNKENTYRASVRMWLDVTQLPKPFQVKAVTAADWKLDSNEWVFDISF